MRFLGGRQGNEVWKNLSYYYYFFDLTWMGAENFYPNAFVLMFMDICEIAQFRVLVT